MAQETVATSAAAASSAGDVPMAFLHPFAQSYIRTRHNNLRCFPACRITHRENSFCGRSVEIKIIKALVGDNDPRKVLVFGYFVQLGDTKELHPLNCAITKEELMRKKNSTYFIAEYINANEKYYRFVIMPNKKWRYDARIGSWDGHMFKVHLATDNIIRSTLVSTPFEIIPVWKSEEVIQKTDKKSDGTASPRVHGSDEDLGDNSSANCQEDDVGGRTLSTSAIKSQEDCKESLPAPSQSSQQYSRSPEFDDRAGHQDIPSRQLGDHLHVNNSSTSVAHLGIPSNTLAAPFVYFPHGRMGLQMPIAVPMDTMQPMFHVMMPPMLVEVPQPYSFVPGANPGNTLPVNPSSAGVHRMAAVQPVGPYQPMFINNAPVLLPQQPHQQLQHQETDESSDVNKRHRKS